MAGSHEVIGSNPLSSTLTLIFIVSIQSPGGLAQLGERMAGSHEVIGSNPLSSTFCFLLRPVLGAHFFEPGLPGFFISCSPRRIAVPRFQNLYRVAGS